MIASILHGVFFGVGWAAASTAIYTATRRTRTGKAAARNVAIEVVDEIERRRA